MNRIVRITTVWLTAAALAACAAQQKEKALDDTLEQYEAMVRWSQWDGAVNYIAPDYLETHPITRLDMERLRLFRVTSYTVRSSTPVDNGDGLVQAVELRMFNRNRAVEQVVIDQQEWRYDAGTERWLLHSGLPDVTQRY